MKRLLLLILLLMPCLVNATPADLNTHAFARMPVLEDGRIKPLDSLARLMLKRIYGQTSYEGHSASQWLAWMFFLPSEAMHAPMFSITSPQAVAMLGLSSEPSHLYSFEALAAVLPARAGYIGTLAQKEKNALSPDEVEVVRVYNVTNDFAELAGSFSLLLPLESIDNTLRTHLSIAPNAPVTLFDLMKHRQELSGALQKIVKHKGTKQENYAPEEKAIAQALARLSLQEAVDRDNALVRLIPPAWGGEEWLSPWGVIASSSGSPATAELLRDWRALAVAYREHDERGWDKLSAKLLLEAQDTLPHMTNAGLLLEYAYNRLALLPLAALFYATGLALVSWQKRRSLGNVALLIGLGLHGIALIMRMLILLRPPVSTLYESLIFVSFVVMAVSIWLGRRNQGMQTLLAGGFTGFALLLASWVFAGDGDTLGVLVAVLNTNFWLATHVVCITTGYGCALVTGAIAHIYLFRMAVRKSPEGELAPLMGLLYRAALLALCFTSIGTMLGGIWADQSWGRFWGWDPKENGALLIVLWLLWLLHGRVAGQLSAFSFALLMALIDVVVAVAWIGVNLLSVGLHSYGFTDTAANGLLGFAAAEFVFVAAMMIIRRVTPQTASGR